MLSVLPVEVLRFICRYLPYRYLERFALTNKHYLQLVAGFDQVPIIRLFITAIKRGKIDGLKLLRPYLIKPITHILEEPEYEEVLPEFCFSFIDTASCYGDLPMIKWLYENYNYEEEVWCSSDAISNAALLGRLDIVKWLFEHVEEDVCEGTLVGIPARGRLDILIWFHNNAKIDDDSENCFIPELMDEAAECGHLHIVKWLHENRTEGCTTKAMDEAASHGFNDIVKFLHENRREGCTEEAMDHACYRGDLDLLIYLHQAGYNCSYMAMDYAAAVGRLDIIQWLFANRDEGCSTKAMKYAAEGSHLDVIDWLDTIRPDGCVNQVLAVVAVNEHIPTSFLEFLFKKHVFTKAEITKGIRKAAKYSNMTFLNWIHENYKPSLSSCGLAITDACFNGNMQTIMWFHERKYEFPPNAIDHACYGRGLEMANWLYENGYSECCTIHVLNFPFSDVFIPKLEWLYQRYKFIRIYMEKNSKYNSILKHICSRLKN